MRPTRNTNTNPIAAIRLTNFRHARTMLCLKMGWERELQSLINGHDPDACNNGERDKFVKKVTRFLAYNYDVHRCPNPTLESRLLPAQHPLSTPVIYPPEWRGDERH